MTDPSDPRAIRPCQRLRAGRAPDPVPFPDDPWTRSDISRRIDPPAVEPAPAMRPTVPRRRPSVLYGALVIVVVVALVLPLTLHLVLAR